jgi:hypothetical protein
MPELSNRESMAAQGWDSKRLGASGSGLGLQVTGLQVTGYSSGDLRHQ